MRGKLHRIDGPAIIWPDGSEAWYQNDVLHRTDGPARYDAENDTYEWWENGERKSSEAEAGLTAAWRARTTEG